MFFWFLKLSYDHIYENTTPQQSLTVVSAEDLETKYGAVVQECGDVSWYHLKSALYAKIPPIDVSPGVIAPAFQVSSTSCPGPKANLDRRRIDPESTLIGYWINPDRPWMLSMDAGHGCYPWVVSKGAILCMLSVDAIRGCHPSPTTHGCYPWMLSMDVPIDTIRR